MAMKRKISSFEEVSDSIQKVYKRVKRIMAGLPEAPLTNDEVMTLYCIIYDQCTSRKGCSHHQLYAMYRDVLEDYIASAVVPAIRDTEDGPVMLSELVKRWQDYHDAMGHWMGIFLYVCKFKLPQLEQVLLLAFRDLVYKEMNGRATKAVICLINKEREGEQIDKALLKKVLHIYVEMGRTEDSDYLSYYKQDFEKQMIDDAALYYFRKASSWILEYSCPDYMRKAEGCLKQERERVFHYLHSSSEPKLIRKVSRELVVVHHFHLLNNEQSGCRALLREERFDDLSRMFRLFQENRGGLEAMADIFKQHITDQGNALIDQQVEGAACNMELTCFGKGTIELHDKYVGYFKSCFSQHKVFHKALAEAFKVFCNKVIVGTPTVELLATFCDNLIKNGDNETVENSLEKVSEVLVYFDDKNLFAEFHRKKLARRLLFDKSAKIDCETSFITKMKQHCSACIISKMEGMLTDMMQDMENQRDLDDWLGNNPSEKPKFDLSVSILTTGLWPSYNSSDLKLPSEMVKAVEAFKKFYETKTRGRKLKWIYSLGNCHIDGKFETNTIELVVKTYQASALLLFNDADSLTFSEIQTQLNLSRDDLVRVLLSLSCAKYKILKKEPTTKTICETDTFEFNTKFTDRMRRIRIPLPPVDKRKKIAEDVNQYRRHHIDAALVRIMKSRKVLGYQQLVSACVELLSKTFKPEIKAIKRQIDDLIRREYLERDSKNQNMLKYLP